jgi:cephalosporin-C deacetylase-like acetyl esterase
MPAFGKQTIFPLFQFFCFWAGAANAQNSSHAIRQFFEQKILRKNNKKVMYKILACFVYRALGRFWLFRLFGLGPWDEASQPSCQFCMISVFSAFQQRLF